MIFRYNYLVTKATTRSSRTRLSLSLIRKAVWQGSIESYLTSS
jgi:hypothetical protein